VAPLALLVRFALATAVSVAAADPVTAPRVGPVADRVAVVVNEEVVLLSEVSEQAEGFLEEARARGESAPTAAQVLDRVVEGVLLRQELAALGLSPTSEDVDRTLDDVARRNKLTRDQLRAEVEKAGMPWDLYREELRANVAEMKFAQAVLRPRVTLSEDELRDAWRRATKDAPARAHVLACFLAWPAGATETQRADVIARAEGLRAQAQAGAAFADLARANDQGPFGAQGGEMGTFAPGELVGELDTAVQATPERGTSAPVVTDKGVFLLHVLERTNTAGNDFETLRPRLQDAVFQQRIAQERVKWAEQARRKATIRVLAPGLQEASAAP
jgi:peptidyl-prolyl cis-trans isomerase SurA